MAEVGEEDLGVGALPGKGDGVVDLGAGDAIGLDAGDLRDLEELVGGEEVEYELTIPGEGGETEVFFSDLSHGYVTINADYTT